MNSPWISVNDKLPQDGQYVLVHMSLTNWGDDEEVYYKVVKFRKGISLETRSQMKCGQIDDPVYPFYGGNSSQRSKVWCSEDEGGNNQRPYCWKEHGPGNYFGQDVDYWMPITPVNV